MYASASYFADKPTLIISWQQKVVFVTDAISLRPAIPVEKRQKINSINSSVTS